MEYRRLGNSGLFVSEIALGAGNFGKRVDQEVSTRCVDYALEHGVNFIDTADWYGNGLSETFVGSALQGRRDQVILATKFGSIVGDGPNDRGSSRYHIIAALENSLRRLQTDHVDLYQMHIPDPSTPLEETLRALDDLVRAGKVRYLGLSNHPSWQVAECLWQATALGTETLITTQARYNLIDRRVEEELIPCCECHDIGVLPWSGLHGGFLTGKYRRGAPPPEGTRMVAPPTINKHALDEINFDKLERLEAFAADRDYSVGQLAIMWLLAKPVVSSVLSGPMRPDQLDLYFSATTARLSADEVAELDRITSITADVDPLYLSFLHQEKAS
jgi:aryl-alcohol dehydrogenase-like predicted oxidoreductase